MARQIPLPALGQYSVTQLQAPSVPVPQTNKLLELAKGLNVVSDIVTTYDQIKQTQSRQQAALEKARALKGEERKAYEQALMTEGATQFQLDPGGVSRQMEAYEREVRKLTEEGKMPPQANALFMLGAKQAKGQVLAKSVYREMLFNPQTISETISPEETVLQKRQELFSRPEFQSELVKQAALKEIEKVEQDFIKDVNARFDAVDIEDAKTNWLEAGRDSINRVINEDLDINDPSLSAWINHPAGIFKESHKYAFDNLIKPSILELVEAGGSAIALEKVEEIENWIINPKTGAKFIKAELKDDIATFKRDIEAKDAYFKNKTKNLYTTNKEKVLNPFVTEFKAKLNDGDIITDSYLKKWTNRVREAGSTSGVFGLDIEETIGSMIELSNKDYYNADTGAVETNTSVWTALQADLDKGIDVLPDAQDALERGDLAWDDFKDIQRRNGDSDRFNKEIMEGVDAIKRATESFGNQFKDTTLTEEMRLKGITPPTTNFVKNITGLNAHPNTLDTLKLRGLLAWRGKVKETRDNILKANPNTTPQQLDEALTNQSLELYETFNEEYRETVLSELRTGKYIMDSTNETITVELLENAIRGIETGNSSLIDLKIEDLILKLEFSDNLEERLQFLRTYKNKIQ